MPIFENEASDDDDTEENNDIKHNEIQQKTKAFNEHLRKNPYDIDSWLEYVEFQNEALAGTDFTSTSANSDGKTWMWFYKIVEISINKILISEPRPEPKTSKASRERSVFIRNKAIVEKKLSILKTALDHNPKSVILYVKRLHLSKEIQDSKTLNRQWKELLFLFPSEIQVLDEYLRFLASHFTSFSLTNVTEEYKNAFQKLKNLAGDAFQQNHADIENQMTNIIIR